MNILNWFGKKVGRNRQVSIISDFRDYRLNIKQDKVDKRDYVKAVMPVKVLPPVLDYSQYVTVKDQGILGSCGSFAAVTGLEMNDKLMKKGWAFELSERFHYWWVRQSQFFGTFPSDSGQDGRSAMAVLLKCGVCPEWMLPYIEADFNKRPGSFDNSFAQFWKTKYYERCYSVEGIKSALFEKKAVWLGVPVQESIFSNRGEVMSYDKKSKTIGGHAMAVIGYDDSRRALRLVNSWNTFWGDAGFSWLSYDYIKDAPWFDAWSFTWK